VAEFAEPFFTPAEIEGLTLEAVHFTKRGGDGKPLKLTELPPRLFSETMRDLDLVVSVAHRGGVDPEASASTLEMRAALVKETCALLKLSNVRIKDNSVLIKGELANTACTSAARSPRKIPGETLFIVAVQAQHRGRLFLPFADNDPRTAEVVSKVLLLGETRRLKIQASSARSDRREEMPTLLLTARQTEDTQKLWRACISARI